MANYIKAQVSSRKGDKIVLKLIHAELDGKETILDNGPAFLEFPLNEESTAFLAECEVYENETATIRPDGDGLFDLRCLIQKGKVLERKK